MNKYITETWLWLIHLGKTRNKWAIVVAQVPKKILKCVNQSKPSVNTVRAVLCALDLLSVILNYGVSYANNAHNIGKSIHKIRLRVSELCKK